MSSRRAMVSTTRTARGAAVTGLDSRPGAHPDRAATSPRCATGTRALIRGAHRANSCRRTAGNGAGMNPSRTSAPPHTAQPGAGPGAVGSSARRARSTYVNPAHSAISHRTSSSDPPRSPGSGSRNAAPSATPTAARAARTGAGTPSRPASSSAAASIPPSGR